MHSQVACPAPTPDLLRDLHPHPSQMAAARSLTVRHVCSFCTAERTVYCYGAQQMSFQSRFQPCCPHLFTTVAAATATAAVSKGTYRGIRHPHPHRSPRPVSSPPHKSVSSLASLRGGTTATQITATPLFTGAAPRTSKEISGLLAVLWMLPV
ncbi:hypothetical protein BO70DRAFT_83353 [Aspergillus heteromorphus CBS 117.55]|uniref:Uncharacterized protein n=1 Tax=Aspergillus heteromorphus CBS 117.55 TaxID=1448321 RepID=A0A317X0D1_9EURO|nr:uncharacterized protein BO70DRAFT_83353 [Aspergillus heteromorphus CBS 117.55]PWY91032.1 hypothetical protein BO70DRAFT_83353 [Aspergillus heteromorphus CBS 117.55]